MFNGVVTARVLCTIAVLPVVSICGDVYVQRCVNRWPRALCDNAVHAAIASLAWLAVTVDHVTILLILQSGLCGLLSSAVDLDHFVAAGSLSLNASICDLIASYFLAHFLHVNDIKHFVGIHFRTLLIYRKFMVSMICTVFAMRCHALSHKMILPF